MAVIFLGLNLIRFVYFSSGTKFVYINFNNQLRISHTQYNNNHGWRKMILSMGAGQLDLW